MAWREATDEEAASSNSGWQEEQPRTWWDTAKSIGQTADDAVRAAANAVTFGMADRLAGAMPSTSTDEQVRLSEEARKRSPYASIAGDVGGAVMLPGIGGRQLAARYGSGLGARAFGYGAEGAALGAAQGAGNTYTGNLEDYITGAAKGGVLGGILGAGGGAVFGARPAVSSAELPNTAQLRGATDAAYRHLRLNPTQYEPPAFSTYADQVAQQLRLTGRVPEYRPQTWDAIDQMRNMQNVTPASIDVIRQGLNRIPKSENAVADREAARIVKNALDDFIANPPAGAVVPGNPQAATDAARIARVAHESRAGQGRAETMGNIRQYAEDLAASQHSGRNVDNIIRQQVRSRLLNPHSPAAQSRLSGFNAAEREALRDVVHAGPVTNTVRMLGNMGGGGAGVATPLIALAGGGAAAGGLAGQYFKDDPVAGGAVGLAAGLSGLGLRSAANRMGRGRIQQAEDLIRQRNPLYEARAAVAPMVVPNPRSAAAQAAARNAITLQILEQQGLPRITVTPREEE